MINILMNQKRGLSKFSKLPDDGDPYKILQKYFTKTHTHAIYENFSAVKIERKNVGFFLYFCSKH